MNQMQDAMIAAGTKINAKTYPGIGAWSLSDREICKNPYTAPMQNMLLAMESPRVPMICAPSINNPYGKR